MKNKILYSNVPASFRVFSNNDEESLLYQPAPIDHYQSYIAVSVNAAETMTWIMPEDSELLIVYLSASATTIPNGSTLTIQVRDPIGNVLYTIPYAADTIGGNVSIIIPIASPAILRKDWQLLLKPSFAVNSLTLLSKYVHVHTDIAGFKGVQI